MQYIPGGSNPKWTCFATRCNKWPQVVTPVLYPLAWAVDALTLPWEDLDPVAFQPVPIWGKWWRSCMTTLAGESLSLLQGGPTYPGSGISSSQIPL